MAQGRSPKGGASTINSTSRSGSGTATALRPASASASQATTTRTVKVTHEQIAKRAHEIWVKRGCKHGHDEQNWLEAERQLRAELAGK